ncbi:long-chain acyl-CoA synthetase [Ekhidna lutea]|uniref:Long-chain acyl-CoA synthetase n=1 Tax=Ekhidna lutea TaxID=447679 RepID=A0A239GZ88_EKHLU|nr:class I adenylate-forming enzyme family protein [Ekhidna lutea]SNS74212.1 long-chain acyl-CoA synthetase [Ekhidna lutea]
MSVTMNRIEFISDLFHKLDQPNCKDRVFLISEKTKFTYKQLLDQVKAIGHFGQVNELKGKTVLVSLSNEFELISTIAGLMSVGVSVLLFDPKTKKRRLDNILSVAKIDGWIVDGDKVAEWELQPAIINIDIHSAKNSEKGVVGKLLKKKQVNQKQTFYSWINKLELLDSFPKIDPDSIAIILFTSGTTADPKGVPLTHGNILSHLRTLSVHYQLNDSSVISNVLPIFHGDGLFQGPFLAMYSGITLSKPLEFEIQKIEELMLSIYKHRVSHFVAVPTILKLINDFGSGLEDSFDTDEFKFVVSTAAYLDEDLWSSFMSRFNVRVVNVYGLSETVAGSFFCGPNDDSFKIGTVGKPVDTEVKIVDEQGQSVEPNDVGELVIRGQHIISSYLIRGSNPDPEGWFYTGDLGFMDSEGFYHIKGRRGSVIIRGGINTYPEELIEVLNQHPEIQDSFVFGEKDDTWGERIVVALVSNDGSSLDSNGVIQYLSKHVAEEHIPNQIHFVSSLKRGASGKIIEEEVRKSIQVADDNPGSKTIGSELKASLLKLAEESFNSNVKPDQYYMESGRLEGWNSLAHLHLATRIEETFNVKLSTKEIMSITSLSAAESILLDKMGKE